jgi:hypothetical protein
MLRIERIRTDVYNHNGTSTPIPTAKGSNTLSVDTTVQPSEVAISGNIKPEL